MSQFLDQFAVVDQFQSEAAIQRLGAGEAPNAVAEALGLGAVGLIAALARGGLGGDDSAGLPLVQGEVTQPGLAAVVAREPMLAELFPGAGRPARLALAAGLLQVLDAWELSHHAAQEADDLGETTTAAAWHMVAHRREPDPSNARYWARRVKSGTIYTELTRLATPLLTTPGGDPKRTDRLVWNPLTLIDWVGKVEPGSAEATLVRRLQRLEMLVLLDHSSAFCA